MSIIKHYGTPRHSGRYPWGSGKDPEQRHKSFLGYVEQLQKEGLSEVEIARGLGMKTTELRNRKSIAKSELRAAQAAQVKRMKEKGMSNVAIGERLGLNESSVRALLNPVLQARSDVAVSTANMLRDTIEKKGIIDIGAGVENGLGISKTKLGTAVMLLKEEGYGVHYLKTQQLGTGKYTWIKVLAPPEMTYSDVYKRRAEVRTISDFAYSPDGGKSYLGLKPIESVSSNRIHIRYKEDGGSNKDGVIELRRGVEDLDLGGRNYAQVRIGVDGTHYLKGMAIYADKMPKGIDIIYNTNKAKGTAPEKVFKEMKPDPDNPFGTVIKPGGQKRALNIVNEQGDWKEWSRNISSQVLSKQSVSLAKQQLDLVRLSKQEELDEIMQLTNPAVKKHLLKAFSDETDSAAVHLKAAALPRQSNHVILPVNSMKETEVYSPTHKDGERVVLIRHPHGGTFEIPELVVNNRNPEARSVIGMAFDAIGIHPKVAQKLSGADFDGDTVLVIPNNKGLIKTSPSLKGLADFDTKESYPPFDGMKTIDGGTYNARTGKVDYGGKPPRTSTKQMQMGDVSNLITDMTIKGARPEEIARAVRHSMVVIDSEKHALNYKQSAIDNGIAALKKKYQGGERAGASTLISRAGSELRVPQRKEGYKIGPNGEKIFEETGAMFVNKKGKTVPKTTSTTKMAEATNPFKLSSGTDIENVYAQHASNLKAMANRARQILLQTKDLVYSPTARETYAPQVAALKAKLDLAYRNKPRERQAQLLANDIVNKKKAANPNMDKADLKKIKGQALIEARSRTGADKPKIEITDLEWEAIQHGAVSNHTLSQILLNTDVDEVRRRATPRTAYVMTPTKVARAKLLAASGQTPAEIAEALGVSVTSIQTAIK